MIFGGIERKTFKEYYEKYWDNKLPKMQFFDGHPVWEDKIIKRYLTFIKQWVKPQDLILDYGCGEGHFVNAMKEYQIVGCDISENAIVRAKKLFPKGLFTDLGIQGVFDVITIFDVMEHIFDFDELFKFIEDHTQEGSKLIIATNEMCFSKMLIIGLFYMNTFFHPYSPHIRFFTKLSIRELLFRHGFKVIHQERTGNYLGLFSKGQFVVAERMSKRKRYWQWHKGDRYTLGRLRELGQLK